jgi:two-component system chemotaxis response regulator CheB
MMKYKSKLMQRLRPRICSLPPPAYKMVVIGASTGGPRALTELFKGFKPHERLSVMIVQHLPADFTLSLAERLTADTGVKVKQAEDREVIQPGKVYVAPGGCHLVIKSFDSMGEVVRLKSDGIDPTNTPSIDITMISAAQVYQHNCIGVLLTGMGRDGVEGLREIQHYNGLTIAEHHSTSIIYGMPKAAIEKEVVDRIVPLHKIAGELES